MVDNSSSYAPYKAKQQKLAKLLNESSEVISVLNMKQYKENLKLLSNKVNNDTFKIQVVGTFKNGKSTFINSFLGSEILPAYATPCTAVINEVKYGEKKKAVLYFKNPLPDQLPSGIPTQTLNHMKKNNMKNVPPIEISYDEIEDYAVIPMGKDPKEMLMESPYEKIELFWPLNLLQNSVEIIDSPGLNEHATRTQVATDYLTKADAVLFVFTATALCSADEMKFIENTLRQKGFEDIYFIVNRFDALGEKDKIRTKEYAKVKLADQTSFGEKGIFFVSALNALEGKENNDMARYNSSGLPEFEKSLADFLVHQKGKMKLLQPARELKRILNEEALFKILPQQQRMLDSSLDDLKKRYEQAKPKLDQLVIKKNQMRERINLLIEQMFPEIRRYINNYFMDLNNSIPVWIKDYEPTNSISIFSVKKGANLLIGELSDFVKDQIEEEQGVWLNETLQPLISDKIKNMMTTIEGSLENFFVELDAIKINITGANTSPVNDIPLWQRVAAAGGGLLIGDIGVATLGGVTGFSKDFAKGIAIQLGAYMGLALFGLLNPVTILLVIGAAVINAILSGGNAMEKKVKDKFVEATLKQINDSSSESVEKMVEDIKKKICELGTMVVNSMDSEINEVQVQVTDIIANMEKGQAQINIRKAELNTCEEQIKTFSTDLDNFIFQLIEK